MILEQLQNEKEINCDLTIKCLMHPNVIEYIDFQGLIQLRLINKEIKHIIDNFGDDIGYWRSICNSYCFFAGTFSPMATDFKYINYKKHFFDELWISRLKWSPDSTCSMTTSNQSYKIKVVNRFRPGEIQSEKVCLPLHQFLKVKRHQQQQQEEKKELLVGEYDPEEFLDPFLGTLMKDPVLLITSNKVLDRSVAVQCILRGGRDPFNKKKLTMLMLIPQSELAQRIQQHREKRHSSWDVSIDTKELKPLLDDETNNNVVHSELLDALMEVEQINLSIQRAEKDAMKLQTDQTSTNQFIHNFNMDNIGAETDEILPETTTSIEEEMLFNAAGEINDLPNDNPFSSNYSIHNSQQSTSNFVSKKIESAGIIDINDKTDCVAMHIPGTGVKPFHYSAVYKGDASQQKIYEKSAQDAVTSVMNGYNASIMCYGQTGSGKTYTFFGPDDSMFATSSSSATTTAMTDTSGIVQRTFQELLTAKDFLYKNNINMSFTAQFIEIYEEQVTDLLTGQVVLIRRDTGEINGAMEASNLINMDRILEILKIGHDRKRFAATAMNDRSSRSHTAIVIHVLQKINKEKIIKIIETGGESGLSPALVQSIQMINNNNNKDKLIRSRLHLIDLAGSERIKKSKAAGVRLKEAVGINSSLLVLGKVISALVAAKSHIPYFESKLTTMLKAAFGGNSKTTVIINCRADCDSGDETLQSMRFGERCGMISNQMRQTATSYTSALLMIEETLVNVKSQLISLENRNKQHLISYKTLLHSYQELERKRKELVLVNNNSSNSTIISNK